MSRTTTKLALYEIDTTTDGNNTFNIDTALNNNWDKIDANCINKSGTVDFVAEQRGIDPTSPTGLTTKQFVENNNDPDIIALGNKSTNFTLTANRVHTASITGSCSLSLPTVSTTTKYVNCMIEFSLASGQSLTMPSVKWDWDYVPTFSTTVKNLILFRTTDNGTTWRACYKQEGA